jgi:alpha-1,6-mannosyltransferase
VIGEGQQRAIVKELLEDEPKAVTWLHYSVDAHYLARVYRASDLFVHPGVEETFGLVALESQACGLPVCGFVGTRLDRIILHDQSFWARENHPVELAVAVEQAMTKDIRRIGQAASEAVAERFSWDQVFPRLFAIYEKVVAEHRTR